MNHPFTRSALALIAGYLTLAFTTGVSAFLLARAFGIDSSAAAARDVPTLFSVVYLLASAAGAVAGGALTACLAPKRPVLHGWILGALLFVAGAGYQVMQALRGLTEPRAEPLWFLLLLPVVGLLSVIAGAYWVESRQTDD